MEHEAEIIYLPVPGLEYVQGVNRPLGELSLAELVQVEADCKERIVQARMDLQMVQDFRERMHPDGDAS